MESRVPARVGPSNPGRGRSPGGRGARLAASFFRLAVRSAAGSGEVPWAEACGSGRSSARVCAPGAGSSRGPGAPQPQKTKRQPMRAAQTRRERIGRGDIALEGTGGCGAEQACRASKRRRPRAGATSPSGKRDRLFGHGMSDDTHTAMGPRKSLPRPPLSEARADRVRRLPAAGFRAARCCLRVRFGDSGGDHGALRRT